MARYYVGDIQGCHDELQKLLTKAAFDPKYDTLYPVGDLVARGPASLETLRFLKSLGKACKPVLGNHDLHLLAVAHGIHPAKPADKLDKILSAKDKIDCLEWLAQQPLIRTSKKHNLIMVHAGIAPTMTLKEVFDEHEQITSMLQSDEQYSLLKSMYGDHPAIWSSLLRPKERRRFTINSLTRMRYCYADGRLDFTCKSAMNKKSHHLLPWYTLSPVLRRQRIVFGHWASLMGRTLNKNAIALDTGCVWGNHLSLWRPKDNKYFKQGRISR